MATGIGARILEHFQTVHREVFLGDPVSNPKLKVEVLAEEDAGDCPTLVLVTPWMVNGVALPPDGELPASLSINGRTYPVFTAEVEGVGTLHSVNLAATTAAFTSHEAARSVAAAMAGPFREAVAAARSGRVADPSRRRLLGLGGG